MEVVTWVLKLLREGPLGGLALGLGGCVWLLRLLLKEKDAHRETWMKVGHLSEVYAALITKETARRGKRDLRLAEKTNPGFRPGGGEGQAGGDDTPGGSGTTGG